MHSSALDTNFELCRQIEMTLADLGYEPPRYGEPFEKASRKILIALLDIQRRLES